MSQALSRVNTKLSLLKEKGSRNNIFKILFNMSGQFSQVLTQILCMEKKKQKPTWFFLTDGSSISLALPGVWLSTKKSSNTVLCEWVTPHWKWVSTKYTVTIQTVYICCLQFCGGIFVSLYRWISSSGASYAISRCYSLQLSDTTHQVRSIAFVALPKKWYVWALPNLLWAELALLMQIAFLNSWN